MKRIFFLIVCGFLIAISVRAQHTSDQIIAKHLLATGLAEASVEIKNIFIEGDILKNKLKFPITVHAILPDKFRMDMMFNNLDFVKVSNGNDTWDYNPMNDTLVETASKGKEALDFMYRWTGGLYNSVKGDYSAKLIGDTLIQDIQVFKLQITLEGETRVYYIDQLSYLIIRIDDDLDQRKITYYSDYRKTDKYTLPYSMVGYEGGIPAISMQFKLVKLNTPIAETVFYKPVKD
ncbi:MAG: hypothetical protein P1P88_18120 [Bacteroidales bacterium]|nr:hypothetical protein [Bacteroidales bacterium]